MNEYKIKSKYVSVVKFKGRKGQKTSELLCPVECL